jgi:hypothetical protein
MHAKVLHSGRRAMKIGVWKTYRTRFLVKAKQLKSNLSFVDHLGRQHSGRKGDYLVESSDGVISIAPRQIFEDIYVAMSYVAMSAEGYPPNPSSLPPTEIMHDSRKLPQPSHLRRDPPVRLGLM